MSNEVQILRMLKGAIQQIDEKGSGIKITQSTYCKHYLRTMCPYSIQKFSNRENLYVVNREYKPLGVGYYSDWVDYDDYPCALSSQMEAALKLILGDALMFYDDGNSPWQSQKNFNNYRKKLEKVIAQIEVFMS